LVGNGRFSGSEDPDGDEPKGEGSASDAAIPGIPAGESNRPSASERKWIHPAELPSRRAIQAPAEPARIPRWIQIPMGVAAASLLLLGATFLARNPPSTDAQTSVLSAVRISDAPDAVGRTADAMTVLTITSPAGSTTAPGIALIGRRVITTTATIPRDALVYADDLHGRPVSATSVHTDGTVGLTALVFTVPVTRAVAKVAAEEDRGPATAVSRVADGAAQPVRWSSASIRSVDTLLSTNGRSIGTVAGESPLADEPCTILMTSEGKAEAISSPSLTDGAFLPASFASGLTAQLTTWPNATHGRLGISGTTSPQGGAEIIEVVAGGPSVGLLLVGDVIVAVNGEEVATTSEMVDAVYLLPSGSTLDLTVRRDGTTAHRAITLAPSP
jgi:hypothetical protein